MRYHGYLAGFEVSLRRQAEMLRQITIFLDVIKRIEDERQMKIRIFMASLVRNEAGYIGLG